MIACYLALVCACLKNKNKKNKQNGWLSYLGVKTVTAALLSGIMSAHETGGGVEIHIFNVWDSEKHFTSPRRRSRCDWVNGNGIEVKSEEEG